VAEEVEAGGEFAEFDSSSRVVEIVLDGTPGVAEDMSGHPVDAEFGVSNDPLPVVLTPGVVIGVKVGSGSVPVYVSVKNGILDKVELLLDDLELVG
jgi:hypothetical protein